MKKTIHSEPYRALINWLKACRNSRGLSMRALAEKLDVPHTLIGKIEQSERRLDIAEYAQLCEALHINPHDGLDLLLSSSYDTAVSRKKQLRMAAEKREHYS